MKDKLSYLFLARFLAIFCCNLQQKNTFIIVFIFVLYFLLKETTKLIKNKSIIDQFSMVM
jgi:hypothetical protein